MCSPWTAISSRACSTALSWRGACGWRTCWTLAKAARGCESGATSIFFAVTVIVRDFRAIVSGLLDAEVTNEGHAGFMVARVSFDARLFSTPDDESKKLISAKAITSISNVGGGGSTVTAALQSGVLKFFDDYRYDRIGIACRLENEVCTMSGIEPAGMGYYLVKGRGVPRIDIIGNQGRVAWPQLMAQISERYPEQRPGRALSGDIDRHLLNCRPFQKSFSFPPHNAALCRGLMERRPSEESSHAPGSADEASAGRDACSVRHRQRVFLARRRPDGSRPDHRLR